ncbi:MAG: cupin domain-containing protein [Propionibacteriaceae bacterium]|jgi:quercetin dioxygenase-like cupin family protein|nr:cupin domain-containing protein [Propionibacteriaceae bacterium]
MTHPSKDSAWLSAADADWTPTGPGATRAVLTWCDEAMLTENRFEAGGVGAMHTHPHIQLTYVASGVFDFTIGDETRRVQAGDSMLLASDVPHAALCIEAGTLVDFFTPHRAEFVDEV